MSLHEPRCLVCSAPLGKGSSFEKDVRKSEVCSDKCYEIYMRDEDECYDCPIHGLQDGPDCPRC
jgi:predicted nucleic acid-binding Zn ribbon protein